jgi:hypothetical protein
VGHGQVFEDVFLPQRLGLAGNGIPTEARSCIVVFWLDPNRSRRCDVSNVTRLKDRVEWKTNATTKARSDIVVVDGGLRRYFFRLIYRAIDEWP